MWLNSMLLSMFLLFMYTQNTYGTNFHKLNLDSANLNTKQLIKNWIESILKKYGDLPEVKMDACQLIENQGYTCEKHDVVTKDGFILGVQRVSGRPEWPKAKREPVFLQHGLLGSSTNWVTNLRNQSLAFILADNGYDVWLGNVRGNTYSRRHQTLRPDTDAFWDWSWDEMAKYDIPAMLTYILNVTQSSQVSYVGHSQGSLVAFAAFSQNPELRKRIKVFFPLAPVANLGHMTSPIRLVAPFAKSLYFIIKLLGTGEFLPSNKLIKVLANDVCNVNRMALACTNILFLIAGFDYQQLNMTRLPVYLSHTPAGTSAKNVVHFAQLVQSGKFQAYDYGWLKNLLRYRKFSPPEYKLEDVKVPVAAFYAKKDWLAVPTDVRYVLSKLPILIYRKYIEEWDHLDFIWADDGPQQCYNDIVGILKRVNKTALG